MISNIGRGKFKFGMIYVSVKLSTSPINPHSTLAHNNYLLEMQINGTMSLVKMLWKFDIHNIYIVIKI